MRCKGINYDTGFARFGSRLSRETFDVAQMRREIEIIAHDLHCSAIRISGRDIDRIIQAAEYALQQGLEVWFAPFPSEMTAEALLPYFAAGAEAAESLRRTTAQEAQSQCVPGRERVVFVLGCEMSLYELGFFPGATFIERIQTMMNPERLAQLAVSPQVLEAQFNQFLKQAVAAVRERFGGPVTYASGVWETVDWDLFDLVGVDLYRDFSNQTTYREAVRSYFAYHKPVVITEFGCCTYRGAAERGAMGWAIVDRAAQPARLTEPVIRDEQVQADYLLEVLGILEEERVEGAFWFTFAGYASPYQPDPPYDLDCASFGVVKVLSSGMGQTYANVPWEPKRSFYALAEHNAQSV